MLCRVYAVRFCCSTPPLLLIKLNEPSARNLFSLKQNSVFFFLLLLLLLLRLLCFYIFLVWPLYFFRFEKNLRKRSRIFFVYLFWAIIISQGEILQGGGPIVFWAKYHGMIHVNLIKYNFRSRHTRKNTTQHNTITIIITPIIIMAIFNKLYKQWKSTRANELEI